MKKNIKEAKKHFENLRKMIAERPSPFAGMSKDEVIEHLRRTRDELWEKKLAAHS